MCQSFLAYTTEAVNRMKNVLLSFVKNQKNLKFKTFKRIENPGDLFSFQILTTESLLFYVR